MSFDDLFSLVLAQCPYYVSQVCSVMVVDDLSSVLRAEHDMILALSLGMRQTIRLVCHTSHLSFAIGLNNFIVANR